MSTASPRSTRRSSRPRSVLTGLVLAALVALSACTSSVGSAKNGYISGDGQTIRIDAADRDAAIELTGTGIDGQPMDLASYRGKPVVINVWGSWCGPCRSEMPLLVDIAQDLQGTAEIIGINVRDETAAAQAFMKNKGGTWPSFDSPDGKALAPFMDSGLMNPKYIPTTLVLDADGRIAASVQGEITKPGTFIRTVKKIAAGE